VTPTKVRPPTGNLENLYTLENITENLHILLFRDILQLRRFSTLKVSVSERKTILFSYIVSKRKIVSLVPIFFERFQYKKMIEKFISILVKFSSYLEPYILCFGRTNSLLERMVCYNNFALRVTTRLNSCQIFILITSDNIK
jgi:hypothetical protein